MEKNIIAYFTNQDTAQRAADRLAAMGVPDIQVDSFGKYPGGSAGRLMNPLTGKISSQSNLVLGDSFGGDSAVLAAADVSVSGMSDGGQDAVSGHNVVLAAVVDAAIFDQALQEVRSAGGWA